MPSIKYLGRTAIEVSVHDRTANGGLQQLCQELGLPMTMKDDNYCAVLCKVKTDGRHATGTVAEGAYAYVTLKLAGTRRLFSNFLCHAGHTELSIYQ